MAFPWDYYDDDDEDPTTRSAHAPSVGRAGSGRTDYLIDRVQQDYSIGISGTVSAPTAGLMVDPAAVVYGDMLGPEPDPNITQQMMAAGMTGGFMLPLDTDIEEFGEDSSLLAGAPQTWDDFLTNSGQWGAVQYFKDDWAEMEKAPRPEGEMESLWPAYTAAGEAAREAEIVRLQLQEARGETARSETPGKAFTESVYGAVGTALDAATNVYPLNSWTDNTDAALVMETSGDIEQSVPFQTFEATMGAAGALQRNIMRVPYLGDTLRGTGDLLRLGLGGLFGVAEETLATTPVMGTSSILEVARVAAETAFEVGSDTPVAGDGSGFNLMEEKPEESPWILGQFLNLFGGNLAEAQEARASANYTLEALSPEQQAGANLAERAVYGTRPFWEWFIDPEGSPTVAEDYTEHMQFTFQREERIAELKDEAATYTRTAEKLDDGEEKGGTSKADYMKMAEAMYQQAESYATMTPKQWQDQNLSLANMFVSGMVLDPGNMVEGLAGFALHSHRANLIEDTFSATMIDAMTGVENISAEMTAAAARGGAPIERTWGQALNPFALTAKVDVARGSDYYRELAGTLGQMTDSPVDMRVYLEQIAENPARMITGVDAADLPGFVGHTTTTTWEAFSAVGAEEAEKAQLLIEQYMAAGMSADGAFRRVQQQLPTTGGNQYNAMYLSAIDAEALVARYVATGVPIEQALKNAQAVMPEVDWSKIRVKDAGVALAEQLEFGSTAIFDMNSPQTMAAFGGDVGLAESAQAQMLAAYPSSTFTNAYIHIPGVNWRDVEFTPGMADFLKSARADAVSMTPYALERYAATEMVRAGDLQMFDYGAVHLGPGAVAGGKRAEYATLIPDLGTQPGDLMPGLRRSTDATLSGLEDAEMDHALGMSRRRANRRLDQNAELSPDRFAYELSDAAKPLLRTRYGVPDPKTGDLRNIYNQVLDFMGMEGKDPVGDVWQRFGDYAERLQQYRQAEDDARAGSAQFEANAALTTSSSARIRDAGLNPDFHFDPNDPSDPHNYYTIGQNSQAVATKYVSKGTGELIDEQTVGLTVAYGKQSELPTIDPLPPPSPFALYPLPADAPAGLSPEGLWSTGYNVTLNDGWERSLTSRPPELPENWVIVPDLSGVDDPLIPAPSVINEFDDPDNWAGSSRPATPTAGFAEIAQEEFRLADDPQTAITDYPYWDYELETRLDDALTAATSDESSSLLSAGSHGGLGAMADPVQQSGLGAGDWRRQAWEDELGTLYSPYNEGRAHLSPEAERARIVKMLSPSDQGALDGIEYWAESLSSRIEGGYTYFMGASGKYEDLYLSGLIRDAGSEVANYPAARSVGDLVAGGAVDDLPLYRGVTNENQYQIDPDTGDLILRGFQQEWAYADPATSEFVRTPHTGVSTTFSDVTAGLFAGKKSQAAGDSADHTAIVFSFSLGDIGRQDDAGDVFFKGDSAEHEFFFEGDEIRIPAGEWTIENLDTVPQSTLAKIPDDVIRRSSNSVSVIAPYVLTDEDLRTLGYESRAAYDSAVIALEKGGPLTAVTSYDLGDIFDGPEDGYSPSYSSVQPAPAWSPASAVDYDGPEDSYSPLAQNAAWEKELDILTGDSWLYGDWGDATVEPAVRFDANGDPDIDPPDYGALRSSSQGNAQVDKVPFMPAQRSAAAQIFDVLGNLLGEHPRLRMPSEAEIVERFAAENPFIGRLLAGFDGDEGKLAGGLAVDQPYKRPADMPSLRYNSLAEMDDEFYLKAQLTGVELSAEYAGLRGFVQHVVATKGDLTGLGDALGQQALGEYGVSDYAMDFFGSRTSASVVDDGAYAILSGQQAQIFFAPDVPPTAILHEYSHAWWGALSQEHHVGFVESVQRMATDTGVAAHYQEFAQGSIYGWEGTSMDHYGSPHAQGYYGRPSQRVGDILPVYDTDEMYSLLAERVGMFGVDSLPEYIKPFYTGLFGDDLDNAILPEFDAPIRGIADPFSALSWGGQQQRPPSPWTLLAAGEMSPHIDDPTLLYTEAFGDLLRNRADMGILGDVVGDSLLSTFAERISEIADPFLGAVDGGTAETRPLFSPARRTSEESSALVSALGGIPGVGKARQQILQDAGFTTVDLLKAANLADLTALRGIGETTARQIKEFLADDFTVISGIGAGKAQALHDAGFYNFAQLDNPAQQLADLKGFGPTLIKRIDDHARLGTVSGDDVTGALPAMVEQAIIGAAPDGVVLGDGRVTLSDIGREAIPDAVEIAPSVGNVTQSGLDIDALGDAGQAWGQELDYLLDDPAQFDIAQRLSAWPTNDETSSLLNRYPPQQAWAQELDYLADPYANGVMAEEFDWSPIAQPAAGGANGMMPPTTPPVLAAFLDEGDDYPYWDYLPEQGGLSKRAAGDDRRMPPLMGAHAPQYTMEAFDLPPVMPWDAPSAATPGPWASGYDFGPDGPWLADEANQPPVLPAYPSQQERYATRRGRYSADFDYDGWMQGSAIYDETEDVVGPAIVPDDANYIPPDRDGYLLSEEERAYMRWPNAGMPTEDVPPFVPDAAYHMQTQAVRMAGSALGGMHWLGLQAGFPMDAMRGVSTQMRRLIAENWLFGRVMGWGNKNAASAQWTAGIDDALNFRHMDEIRSQYETRYPGALPTERIDDSLERPFSPTGASGDALRDNSIYRDAVDIPYKAVVDAVRDQMPLFSVSPDLPGQIADFRASLLDQIGGRLPGMHSGGLVGMLASDLADLAQNATRSEFMQGFEELLVREASVINGHERVELREIVTGMVEDLAPHAEGLPNPVAAIVEWSRDTALGNTNILGRIGYGESANYLRVFEVGVDEARTAGFRYMASGVTEGLNALEIPVGMQGELLTALEEVTFSGSRTDVAFVLEDWLASHAGDLSVEQRISLRSLSASAILPMMDDLSAAGTQVGKGMANYTMLDTTEAVNLVEWTSPFVLFGHFRVQTAMNMAERLLEHPSLVTGWARRERLLEDYNEREELPDYQKDTLLIPGTELRVSNPFNFFSLTDSLTLSEFGEPGQASNWWEFANEMAESLRMPLSPDQHLLSTSADDTVAEEALQLRRIFPQVGMLSDSMEALGYQPIPGFEVEMAEYLIGIELATMVENGEISKEEAAWARDVAYQKIYGSDPRSDQPEWADDIYEQARRRVSSSRLLSSASSTIAGVRVLFDTPEERELVRQKETYASLPTEEKRGYLADHPGLEAYFGRNALYPPDESRGPAEVPARPALNAFPMHKPPLPYLDAALAQAQYPNATYNFGVPFLAIEYGGYLHESAEEMRAKMVMDVEATPAPRQDDFEWMAKVGELTEERLYAAGYTTLGALSLAKPEALAEIDGVSLPTARRIIEQAQNRLRWEDEPYVGGYRPFEQGDQYPWMAALADGEQGDSVLDEFGRYRFELLPLIGEQSQSDIYALGIASIEQLAMSDPAILGNIKGLTDKEASEVVNEARKLAGLPELEELRDQLHAVYALVDPRDGRVFYIGQTNDPDRRIAEHIEFIFGGRQDHPKAEWGRELLKAGQLMEMHVLDWVPSTQIDAEEMLWVGYFLYVEGRDDMTNVDIPTKEEWIALLKESGRDINDLRAEINVDLGQDIRGLWDEDVFPRFKKLFPDSDVETLDETMKDVLALPHVGAGLAAHLHDKLGIYDLATLVRANTDDLRAVGLQPAELTDIYNVAYDKLGASDFDKAITVWQRGDAHQYVEVYSEHKPDLPYLGAEDAAEKYPRANLSLGVPFLRIGPGGYLHDSPDQMHDMMVMDVEKLPDPEDFEWMAKVGEVTEGRLYDGGFRTVEQLAYASPQDLDQVEGISYETARAIVQQAQWHLMAMDEPYAGSYRPPAAADEQRDKSRYALDKYGEYKRDDEGQRTEVVYDDQGRYRFDRLDLIGAATMSEIYALGITQVEDLAIADPERLSYIKGLTITKAQEIVDQARGELGWSLLYDDVDMPHAVYALVDPRDQEIYYIGQTNDPARRLGEHIDSIFGGRQDHPKASWGRDMLQDNQFMQMQVIGWTGSDSINSQEKLWIGYFIYALGRTDMVNVTVPGREEWETLIRDLGVDTKRMGEYLAQQRGADVLRIWDEDVFSRFDDRFPSYAVDTLEETIKPLSDLPILGPTTAARLWQIGIATPADIVRASDEELLSAGIDEDRLAELRQAAYEAATEVVAAPIVSPRGYAAPLVEQAAPTPAQMAFNVLGNLFGTDDERLGGQLRQGAMDYLGVEDAKPTYGPREPFYFVDATQAPGVDSFSLAVTSWLRSSETMPGGEYTMKRGDTLLDIAREVYGDPLRWRDIYDANADVFAGYYLGDIPYMNDDLLREGRQAARLHLPTSEELSPLVSMAMPARREHAEDIYWWGDFLVSYNAQGQRLDSLGHVAYDEGEVETRDIKKLIPDWRRVGYDEGMWQASLDQYATIPVRDDLTLLPGISDTTQVYLNTAGIFTFEQLESAPLPWLVDVWGISEKQAKALPVLAGKYLRGEPLAEPEPEVPVPDGADDFTFIEGVGASTQRALYEKGIFHLADLAAIDDAVLNELTGITDEEVAEIKARAAESAAEMAAFAAAYLLGDGTPAEAASPVNPARRPVTTSDESSSFVPESAAATVIRSLTAAQDGSAIDYVLDLFASESEAEETQAAVAQQAAHGGVDYRYVSRWATLRPKQLQEVLHISGEDAAALAAAGIVSLQALRDAPDFYLEGIEGIGASQGADLQALAIGLLAGRTYADMQIDEAFQPAGFDNFEDLPAIGRATEKALYDLGFTKLDDLLNAPLTDLLAVPGISIQDTQLIKAYAGEMLAARVGLPPLVAEADDFSLVPGISGEARVALYKAGIYSFHDVLMASDARLISLNGIGASTAAALKGYSRRAVYGLAHPMGPMPQEQAEEYRELDETGLIRPVGQISWDIEWNDYLFDNMITGITPANGDSASYMEDVDPRTTSTALGRPAPGQMGPVSPRMSQGLVLPASMQGNQAADAMVDIWNEHGDLLSEIAGANELDPITLASVLAVESGGAGFVDERLKIRFELHRFWANWGEDNPIEFAQAFHMSQGLTWKGHQVMGEDGKWADSHAGQEMEWHALELAMELDPEAAWRSTSMGASQVLGENFGTLGYASASEMAVGFSESEDVQIKGMFDYILGSGAGPALKRGDMAGFVRSYNGPGNVDTYTKLIEQNKAALGAVLADQPADQPVDDGDLAIPQLLNPFVGEYSVTQNFGGNAAAYAKFGLAGHEGTDWGVPSGTPLYASDDGVVDTVGWDPGGYGKYVKVEHAWGYTLYAHLSDVDVEEGDAVGVDTMLGASGNTGNSEGPHLHFSIIPNDTELAATGFAGRANPLPYMVQRDAAGKGLGHQSPIPPTTLDGALLTVQALISLFMADGGDAAAPESVVDDELAKHLRTATFHRGEIAKSWDPGRDDGLIEFGEQAVSEEGIAESLAYRDKILAVFPYTPAALAFYEDVTVDVVRPGTADGGGYSLNYDPKASDLHNPYIVLFGEQYEASLHELSHAWWNRQKLSEEAAFSGVDQAQVIEDMFTELKTNGPAVVAFTESLVANPGMAPLSAALLAGNQAGDDSAVGRITDKYQDRIITPHGAAIYFDLTRWADEIAEHPGTYDPKIEEVVTLYVRGDDNWEGQYRALGMANDDEIFAGLASLTMGDTDLMPDYMARHFAGLFMPSPDVDYRAVYAADGKAGLDTVAALRMALTGEVPFPAGPAATAAPVGPAASTTPSAVALLQPLSGQLVPVGDEAFAAVASLRMAGALDAVDDEIFAATAGESSGEDGAWDDKVVGFPAHFDDLYPTTSLLLDTAGFKNLNEVAISSPQDLVNVGVAPDAAYALVEAAREIVGISDEEAKVARTQQQGASRYHRAAPTPIQRVARNDDFEFLPYISKEAEDLLYAKGVTKIGQLLTMSREELSSLNEYIGPQRAETILKAARLAQGDPSVVDLLYGVSPSFRMENSRFIAGKLVYQVQTGETLMQIAQRVYGDPLRWREIARNNASLIDAFGLRAGMALVLPGVMMVDAGPGHQDYEYWSRDGNVSYNEWGQRLDSLGHLAYDSNGNLETLPLTDLRRRPKEE